MEALQDSLGFHSYPYVETVASEGSGVIETFKLVSKLTFVDLLRRLQRGWQPSAETPAVRPGEAFAALSDETPAATEEEAAAAVIPEVPPVLAVSVSAGVSDRGELPPEEPSENPIEENAEAWVVPSVEGAFPDLSEDSAPSSTLPAAEARSAAEESPAAAQTPPEATLAPAVLLAALAAPPPAPPAPKPPPASTITHVSPPPARSSTVDEKLNAVLAETRRAAGRVSGSFRRLDASDVNTQEIPAREAAERRLEEAIATLRAELSGEMVRLRDELATARAAASSAESAAAAANDRARRLEDALRQAFRGLAD